MEYKNKDPLVSIIIPTYNHGHLIGRCLKSVIDQIFGDWEAIVVNNFSKDDTINIVNGFGDDRIRLVTFSNNGIIAASRNEGLRHSRGRFIAFLDSDDWWHPQKLLRSIKYLANADLVYHDLAICGVGGRKYLKKVNGRRLKKPAFIDLMTRGNALPNSSVVVNKELIIKAGGFDEEARLVACEDFDLWLRISRLTNRFVYIPETLGVYWVGVQNMTEISERGIERIENVYKKHYCFLSDEDKRQADFYKNYLIGKIRHKMRLWDDAVKRFRIACGSFSFETCLKARCCIVMITIQCLFERLKGKI